MSKSEYQSPEVYDAEYGSYTDDFKFFVGLKNHGNALDLACGTGRLTIALAKSGVQCVGLDSSPEMLDLAREKSKGLGIDYLEEDIRKFSLGQKFDLITLTGNSFQALLTEPDQKSMLACVKNHLKAGGVFAFNTRVPHKDELCTVDDFVFWHSFTDNNGKTVDVYGKQSYDKPNQIVTYTTKRIWPNRESLTTIGLKFTAALDIFAMLESIGLKILNTYGDFSKTPFTEKSKNLIAICTTA